MRYKDADFIARKTREGGWSIYRRAPELLGAPCIMRAALDDDEAFDTFCAGVSAQRKSLYNAAARRFECGTVEQLARSRAD